jgi:ABC-type transport system involved in cytochrome c biogenesis permease component
MLVRLRSGLPVLKKDLAELAARKRTYLVRGLYAAGLFAAFAFVFYGSTARLTSSPASLLGIGRRLLGYAVVAQIVGIYVFLPAIVSGCITEEKEKGTLGLMLISDLTPGEIVVQKLVSRLVPMLTLLLLSLPLMAVCYSLGGLSARKVGVSAVVLVTTCAQAGAFSVMVSAYSRTSSEALLATYGYYVLLLVVAWILAGLGSLLLAPALISGSFVGGCIGMIPAVIAMGLTPPVAMLATPGGALFPLAVVVAAWAWSGVFLWKARRYLVERIHIPPKRRKHGFFGQMVRYARREAARRRKRGDDRRARFPDDEPVLWRDTTNTYLDWPHGFRGTLGFVLFPMIYMLAIAALLGRAGEQCWWITFLASVLWIAGAVAVTVRSSRAFASERARGTLDVLLTTPLAGADIVRQKMKASWRLALVFAVPLIVLFLVEAWLETAGMSLRMALDAVLYLAAATLAVFIFLPAFGWVSLLLGMRMRDARRATLTALGVVLAWNVGPPLVAGWFVALVGSAHVLVPAHLALLSPMSLILFVESGFRMYGDLGFGFLSALPGFAVNAAIFLFVRRACLKNADRYLGRGAVGGAISDVPATGGVA